MGGRLLEGPTMVGGTSDWKDELARFLKPFLDRLGHKARRQMCGKPGLAGVARARKYFVELSLEYGLQAFASSIAKACFDRIEPIGEKMFRRLDFRLRQASRCVTARHGVISAGISVPESLLHQAGDYAAFIFQPLPATPPSVC